MARHEEEELDNGSPTTPPSGRSADSLRQQAIGALIGAAAAFLLAMAAQQFGWVPGDVTRYVLWGGAIGGLVGGSDTLAQAGRRLTHSDADWLNALVALLGMAVISGVLYAIATGILYILRHFLAK